MSHFNYYNQRIFKSLSQRIIVKQNNRFLINFFPNMRLSGKREYMLFLSILHYHLLNEFNSLVFSCNSQDFGHSSSFDGPPNQGYYDTNKHENGLETVSPQYCLHTSLKSQGHQILLLQNLHRTIDQTDEKYFRYCSLLTLTMLPREIYIYT